MNDVLMVFRSRRSIRAFTEDKISKNDISSILDAGVYAPSANISPSIKVKRVCTNTGNKSD
jgi:nitroreductase